LNEGDGCKGENDLLYFKGVEVTRELKRNETRFVTKKDTLKVFDVPGTTLQGS
jgi:hypothetical protein